MIEYNYLIDRNEGNEWVRYTPKGIPQKLPPLVYIEGPNSSGKSTLLNLIALSFNGHKRNDINPNLRKKVEALLDTTYQNLDFNLEIAYGQSKLKISKSNNSDKIIRELVDDTNQKRLLMTTDLMEEKYNLIYDIPENPITRLNDMSKNLHLAQTKQLEKITHYIEQYRDILNDVKNSRDENRVNSLQIEIRNQKTIYDELQAEIDKEREVLEIVQKYAYTRAYRKTTLELQEVEEKIADEKWFENKSKIKRNKDLDKLLSEFDKFKISVKSDLNNLISNLGLIKYDKKKINEFSKFQKEPVYKLTFIQKKYYNLIDSTLDDLKKIDRTQAQKAYSKISAYNELINVLEKYKNDDLELPGEKGKFYDLLITLKTEVYKDYELTTSFQAIDDSIDLLKSLRDSVKHIDTQLVPKYQKIKSNDNDDGFSNNIDVEKLEERKKYLKNLQSEYSNYCTLYNVNLIDDDNIHSAIQNIKNIQGNEVYRNNKDDDNFKLIESMEIMLNKKIMKANMIDGMISREVENLEKIKKMSPHGLHGKSVQIEEVIKRLQKSQTQLKKYNEYLDSLIHHAESELKNIDPDKKSYFEKVSIYLGKHLGIVRHVDQNYRVEKVDLITKQLITEGHKVIRFNDMGTGQSQAAYLLSKLSSIDERKVVVLFDEIAMMDKVSLKPVFDKLHELYEKKILVCAVVVQKSDVINVKSLGEFL